MIESSLFHKASGEIQSRCEMRNSAEVPSISPRERLNQSSPSTRNDLLNEAYAVFFNHFMWDAEKVIE